MSRRRHRLHADDAAIAELLDTVREARTSLAIDLAAAAGALESDRPEIARDIVAATAAELRNVTERSAPARTRPVTPRRSRDRRRLLLALPAVPLVGAIAMTTAAAIAGSSPHAHTTPTVHVAAAHHVVELSAPSATSSVVAHEAAGHEAATTTLHRLEHVVTHHPQAAQVLAVVDHLHKQLTAMIARSTDDPARLHVVRHLLAVEQHVLESSKVPGTQLALVAARELARLLKETPQPAHTSSYAPPRRTTPSTAPTPTPTAAHTAPATRATTPSTSHSQLTRHTPTAKPTNALFGRGIFTRH